MYPDKSMLPTYLQAKRIALTSACAVESQSARTELLADTMDLATVVRDNRTKRRLPAQDSLSSRFDRGPLDADNPRWSPSSERAFCKATSSPRSAGPVCLESLLRRLSSWYSEPGRFVSQSKKAVTGQLQSVIVASVFPLIWDDLTARRQSGSLYPILPTKRW